MSVNKKCETDIYSLGKDGSMTKLGIATAIELTPSKDDEWLTEWKLANEGMFELPTYPDICINRFFRTLIDPRLGCNNWRKLHGLPMWRLK